PRGDATRGLARPGRHPGRRGRGGGGGCRARRAGHRAPARRGRGEPAPPPPPPDPAPQSPARRQSAGGRAVIGMSRRLALHPAVLWTVIALAAIKIIWGSLTWDVWHVLAELGALGAFWYALRHAR